MKIYKHIDNEMFQQPICVDKFVLHRHGLKEKEIKGNKNIEIWLHFEFYNDLKRIKNVILDINTIENINKKIVRNKFYWSDLEAEYIDQMEIVVNGEYYMTLGTEFSKVEQI